MMDGEDKDPFRFSVLQSTESSSGARKALERQDYKPILSGFYGESVGKLLSRLVARSYVGYAAEVILSNWRFPPTWRENFEFVGAIYRGYYTNQNSPEKEFEFVQSLIQQTTKTPQSPFGDYLHNRNEPTAPSATKLIRRSSQVAPSVRVAISKIPLVDLTADSEDEDNFMANRRRLTELGVYN